MSSISISSYKNLESYSRIDPEYYQEKYFQILKKLKKKDSSPLSNFVSPREDKFKKDVETFNYVEISGIDTLTSGLEYTVINTSDAPSRAQKILKENDIIISYVRPNRKAISIITKQENNFVGTSGLGVYKPEKISSEYLLPYLKTDLINSLITRKATASEYPAISNDDFLTTPIIVFEDIKDNVRNIILDSQKHIQLSKKNYVDAEKILYEITNFNSKNLEKKFSNTNFSQIKKNYGSRIDSKFYCNNVDTFLKKLEKKGKLKKIKELIKKPINNGVSPTYDEDGKITLVNSQHLGKYGLNFGATDKVSENFYKKNSKAKIAFEDVLVYATGAYFGRSNIFLEKVEAMSGLDVLMIKFDENLCDPYYASLYINSNIGQAISKKYFTGSAQEHLYDHHLDEYTMFIPSDKKYIKEISMLVKTSYEEKQKAYEKLKNAIDIISSKLDKV